MTKEYKQKILTDLELKQLQDIELELLIEFDRICRKHNITYTLDGGTLLGAVRHKGFIPWDDDADVAMTRGEYNKFLSVVDKELDFSKYYYHDINKTEGYRWGYSKLRRMDSEFIRLNQEFMPYKQGIFLDIFIYDNVPDNYIFRCIGNFQSFVLRKTLYSVVGSRTASGFSKVAYKVLNLIPEKNLKNIYRRYVAFRNRIDTRLVKCITWPASDKTYGCKREWFEDVIDIDFCGIKFLGSKDYNSYLKLKYGNYMNLPPIGDRKVHPVSKISFPSN